MAGNQASRILASGTVLAVLVLAGGASAMTGTEIRGATGIQSGFCIHVGVGDAAVTADLHNQGKILVYGLTNSAAELSAARDFLRGQGLYGLVSVDRVSSYGELPFMDNLADLVVCDKDAVGAGAPSSAEILRVLRPGGVAYVGSGGSWQATTKPVPAAIDEWTHLHHDASGNPQSSDSLAGAIRGIQWYVPHERTNCQLFAGGRVLMGGTRQPGVGDGSYFVARNAWNGILEWSVKENDRANIGEARGVSMVASVCADGQRVYGTVIDTGKAQVVDLATGQVTRLTEGITIPPKSGSWEKSKVTSVLHLRYEDALIQAYERTVMSLDAATGSLNWRYDNPDNTATSTMCMSAGGSRIYVAYSTAATHPGIHYGNKSEPINSIVALNASNGTESWRNVEVAGDTTYNLAYHNGAVYYGDLSNMTYKAIVKIDAATGAIGQTRTITQSPGWGGTVRIRDGYLIPSSSEKVPSFNLGDLSDGPILFNKTGKGSYFGHCSTFRGSAFGQNAGNLGFVDFRTGTWEESYVSRNGCDQSTTPAYGMMFPWPSGCACWPYLHGQAALRCSTATTWTVVPDGQRVEPGVAFTPDPATAGAWPIDDEWPILYHDGSRNNYGTSPLGDSYDTLYRIQVPVTYPAGPVTADQRSNIDAYRPITPPVIGEGKLIVAATDAHRVHAYEARSGAASWTFTAGGRIDSPPVIYRGLCLFGARDGYVCALRLSDGALVWRFLAAPARRNIVVAGQVENLWPVHGTVMIHEGKLFVSAGRHSDADDGIRIYRLDPFTGALEAKRTITRKQIWSADATPYLGYGYFGTYSGCVNDLLCSNNPGNVLFMHNVAIEPASLEWADMRAMAAGANIFPNAGGASFTKETPGIKSYSHISREGTTNQNDYSWMYNVNVQVRNFNDGVAGKWVRSELPGMRKDGTLYIRTGGHLAARILAYALDANGEPLDPTSPETLLDGSQMGNLHTAGRTAGSGIASGNKVVIAGYTESGWTNILRVFDLSAKTKVYETKLPTSPIKDGLAAAYGNIYVSLANGTVMCLGPTDPTPPSAPTALKADSAGGSRIVLSWAGAQDAESGIREYRVYRDGSFRGVSPTTSFADSGLTELTQHTYTVSAVNGTGIEGAKSSPLAVSSGNDTQAPRLQAVSAMGIATRVTVVFTETVEQASAEVAGNYSIDNGVSVSAAVVAAGGRAVELTTSTLATDITYTLTVNNVRDRAQIPNAIAPNSTKTFEYLTIVPGLYYEYYEGSWSALPDFSSLTPKTTGEVQDFDISVAEAADNFVMRFSGIVSVPADGQYTFYTASDDGSRLYVDGVMVVDNDGLHGNSEKNGTVNLTAGNHAIVVTFLEATGGQSLTVSWQGPDIGKREIPAGSLYYQPGETSVAARDWTSRMMLAAGGTGGVDMAGMRAGASHYEAQPAEGDVAWGASSVGNMAIAGTSVEARGTLLRQPWVRAELPQLLDLGMVSTAETQAQKAEVHLTRLRGYVHASETGSFTFWVTAPGAAALYLSDCDDPARAALIARAAEPSGAPGGDERGTWEGAGTVELSAGGRYYVELIQRESLGQGQAELSWAGPSHARTPLRGEALSPWALGTGRVVADYWSGIAGDKLADLLVEKELGGTTYPENPTGRRALKSLGLAGGWADNFAERIRGYVHAPVTGEYTFWIAAGGEAQLWLSESEDPAAKSLVASAYMTGPRDYDVSSDQAAEPVKLVGGRSCYFEVIRKAGGGEDHCSVAWETPDSDREVIGGAYLSPFVEGAAGLASAR